MVSILSPVHSNGDNSGVIGANCSLGRRQGQFIEDVVGLVVVSGGAGCLSMVNDRGGRKNVVGIGGITLGKDAVRAS